MKLTTSSLVLFVLLHHLAYSQIPVMDSVQFRNIRYTKNPLTIPQGNTTLFEAARERGINTSSNAYQRMLAEIAPILDPKTSVVPRQAMYKAQEDLLLKAKNGRVATVAGWNWYERGPNDIGGRTRALIFDPNDGANSYKKVWAGSVSGGLWYNTDITNAANAWTKVNDFWDNLAITCIAYDPSNTQRFYAGTGEGFFNIDYVQGAGIFYSSNGGTSWTRLASTIPVGTSITDAFKFVQKIVVNSSGHVFAATQSGILKSIDQGNSWTFVMQPSTNTGITGLGGTDFVSDLEIGTDGVLYAATSSGKIVKSTDIGVTWTNITPSGLWVTFRTEIGLANSTSGATQTLYVVSYNQFASDVWFLKSVNAGSSWTDVTIPNVNISGQGWYDLILAVHPTNANAVYIGAVRNARSIDGGTTWGAALDIHTDHHNFVFRPGSNDMIIGEDGGVYYSSTWGNVANATPTATTRNKGYNVTQMYSVGIKNINDNGYAIAGSQDNGTHKITTAYNTIGASGFVSGGDGMLSFIDQNNPNVQIVSYQYLAYLLADANGTVTQTLLDFPYGDFINPADYDGAANIFYAKYTPPSGNKILKCLNVGTDNTIDTTTITGLLGGITFIKVGKTANTIFLGTSAGRVYKVSGMNAASATATLIGTFSNYISCIDVGATDNELLVTMSNFGTSSVQYTNNGGSSWSDKDQAAYGLPNNIPVRYGLFFPYDRKKVIIATDLGVFYCADITVALPSWTDARASTSGTNIGNVRCDWMQFRSSDGMLAVGTHGRGIFFSDYFKSQVPLALNLTSTTISNGCSSGSITITFETQGDFGANTFIAQLSDATGSFTSPTSLGAVVANTNNVKTLPVVPNGTGYKIRIVASGGAISNLSDGFTIQTVNFNNSTPVLVTAHNIGGIIKLSTSAVTTAYWVAVASGAVAPNATQIAQGKNATGVATYAGSFVIDAASANRYLDISILPSGVAFDVYIIPQNCSIATPVKVVLTTIGSNTTYCQPTYSNSCSSTAVIISRAKISRGNTTIFDNANSGCSSGNYGTFLYPQAQVQANDVLTLFTDNTFSGGSYYGQNLTVWVDYNRDGVFGNSVSDPAGTERVYRSNLSPPPAPYPSSIHSSSFVVPNGIAPGFLRVRFRTQYYGHGQVANPCTNYSLGETEDYVIWVAPTLITNTLGFSLAAAGSNVLIPYSYTGTFNGGNVFTVQIAPASSGVFTNQTTSGASSPLTASLSNSLVAGEYIARIVSSNPAVNGITAPNSFIISPCPTSYNLSGSTSTGTIKYETSGSIESVQVLSGDAKVKYDGSTYVLLKPGFSATPITSGYFTAYIDGCGGALRVGNSDEPPSSPASPQTPIENPVLPPTKLPKLMLQEVIKN